MHQVGAVYGSGPFGTKVSYSDDELDVEEEEEVSVRSLISVLIL